MSSKESACFRILRKYGFMVDGPADVLKAVERWPKSKPKETFKQWKSRIFGGNVKIMVYAPYEPEPQTRISTLARDSGGEHLKSIFQRYGRFKDRKLENALGEVEEEVVERLSTFPRDTLASLLDEFDDSLQPSVAEFFERYLKSSEQNVDTESLLRELIKTYNDAVAQFRKAGLTSP